MSSKFSRGKGLSVFSPYKVAKKYNPYYRVLFCLYFIDMGLVGTPPSNNCVRDIGVDQIIVEFPKL